MNGPLVPAMGTSAQLATSTAQQQFVQAHSNQQFVSDKLAAMQLTLDRLGEQVLRLQGSHRALGIRCCGDWRRRCKLTPTGWACRWWETPAPRTGRTRRSIARTLRAHTARTAVRPVTPHPGPTSRPYGSAPVAKKRRPCWGACSGLRGGAVVCCHGWRRWVGTL